MTRIIIAIPARFQSTRLPGKPLADIAGKPMVQRVYEQVCKTQAYKDGASIVIATDHIDIQNTCQQFGATALLTNSHHPTGTDRLEEVATLMGLDDNDIMINVQGDEPLIPPEVIDQVIDNLQRHQQFDMATLATEILSDSEFNDTSAVKVVTDIKGKALYFSRSPIPSTAHSKPSAMTTQSQNTNPKPLRHIGLYGYRTHVLRTFSKASQPYIEVSESLEQLRFLFYGYAIHVGVACAQVPTGIDTPENLVEINALFLE